MKRNSIIRYVCIVVIIIVLLSLLIVKCKHPKEEPIPTTIDTAFVSISKTNDETVKNSTKILVYHKNTHLDTCGFCIKFVEKKGWKPILIERTSEFFTRITPINNQKISELVIVIHSIPGRLGNYFDLTDITDFARKLKPLIDSNTIIYLNGCNTGIKSYDYSDCYGISNSQRLANLTQCTVFGSKGFLTGSFPESNEQCYDCDGTYCTGIRDSFSRVWKRCTTSVDNCAFKSFVKSGSSLYANLLNMKTNNNKNLLSSYNHHTRPFPDFQLQLKFEEKINKYDFYLLEGLLYDNRNELLYSYTKNEFKMFLDSIPFFTKGH